MKCGCHVIQFHTLTSFRVPSKRGRFFLVQFGEKALWRPVILSAMLNVAVASFCEQSECIRRESGRCLPATTECAGTTAAQTNNLRCLSSSDSERLHSASSTRIFVLQRCDPSATQQSVLEICSVRSSLVCRTGPMLSPKLPGPEGNAQTSCCPHHIDSFEAYAFQSTAGTVPSD